MVDTALAGFFFALGCGPTFGSGVTAGGMMESADGGDAPPCPAADMSDAAALGSFPSWPISSQRVGIIQDC